MKRIALTALLACAGCTATTHVALCECPPAAKDCQPRVIPFGGTLDPAFAKCDPGATVRIVPVGEVRP